jgi:cyclopropane fatty-acyl-phospholipid synthase-like methyltransferase
MTVAEIGSGWGSLAIHLARFTGARITAINVSPAQISVARERRARGWREHHRTEAPACPAAVNPGKSPADTVSTSAAAGKR